MKDELSRDAQALLEAARASFSPDEPRIAAVRAAIGARLGAPAPRAPEGSSLAEGGSAITGAAAPYVLVLVAAVALIGGAAAVEWPHHRAAVVAPTADAPAPVAPDLRIASPASERPAPDPPLPTVNADQLPAVAPSNAHPGRSPLRARATRPAPAPTVPVESPAPAASQPAPDDSLAREASLLRAARAALDRGDAERALGLLGRHAQLWPSGALIEERLATQVLALCALGRVADARAAARDLEAVSPASPHLARVRASCVLRQGGAGP